MTVFGILRAEGHSVDEGRLFTGMSKHDETRLKRNIMNMRSLKCGECGATATEAKYGKGVDKLRMCGDCRCVWWCSRACQERNWYHPPTLLAALPWVPESISRNPRLRDTTLRWGGSGFSVTPHKDVCRLLQDAKTISSAIEKRIRGGEEGSKSPKHYRQLARSCIDRGFVDKAIAAYQETIRLGDTSPESHDELGMALLLKTGRSQEALDAFQAALRFGGGRARYFS